MVDTPGLRDHIQLAASKSLTHAGERAHAHLCLFFLSPLEPIPLQTGWERVDTPGLAADMLY